MTDEKLPKVADSHVQSSDSDIAVRAVLRKPQFILRKQEEDYGVDFLAEALTDSQDATNWHLAIQLRSENPPRLVQDGKELAVRFKTSALNYLFRWPGRSVVVVYDDVSKRLYWEWTDRVVTALDARGRPWRDQNTVKVRVPTGNELTLEAADFLRREVLAYHQAAESAAQNVLVTRETAERAPRLTGATHGLDAIREGGTGLVSAGLHREVLAILQGIAESEWRGDPVVVATLAYAYERSGSPLQALYYANRVSDDAPTLDHDNKALILFIRSNARLALGQIGADAYWEELRQIATRFPETLEAAQARLVVLAADAARAGQSGNRNDTALRQIAADARTIVANALQRMPGKRNNWALDILLGQVEAEIADQLLVSHITRMRVAEKMGRPLPQSQREAMAHDVIGLTSAASNRLRAVTTEAREANELQWEHLAHLRSVESELKRLGLLTVMGAVGDEEGHRERVANLAAEAEQLAEAFAESHHRGFTFRARRLQGEAYAMLGDEAKLEVVLEDLKRWARDLGLPSDATKLVGPFSPPPLDEQSQAQWWANATSEDLQPLEDSVMEAAGLPETRRPVLRRDIRAQQRLYREQLEHCRHLELLQDMRHKSDPATHYAHDPARVCLCKLLGYRSQFESTDVDAVIRAFKEAYCAGCEHRNPFGHE